MSVLAEQITDDEAALYDRQIRLWGVEAQRRLRQANVLVAGVDGVGSEVIKNLVLAGVNSIILIDHADVSKYDMTSNLFTHRLTGRNRAEVASGYVQALNPMVKVTYETVFVGDKEEEFFKQFDVVILSGFDKETVTRVNNFCHQNSVKFYAVSTWGFFGFGFVDLGSKHKCIVEEVEQSGEVNIAGEIDVEEEGPSRKKVKTQEPTLQVVEKTIDFVPFEVSLAVRAGKQGMGLTRRTNSVFILMHVMFAFHSKHGRFPHPTTRESDVEELVKLKEDVLDKIGLDEGVLRNAPDWQKAVFGQLSPVCAVVGGVIGQDIIRSLSGKDAPIRNFFLFNGLNYSGAIETVGQVKRVA